MPVDVSSSQKAMDQTEYQSNFWKPKAGPEFVDNFVRVLPPHEALGDDLFLPVSLHWPPQGASWAAFLCPREMNNEYCPIHEAGFAELKKLKLEMDEKSAKDAVRHHWSSWGYYFTVVLLNKDGTVADETPKILSANKDLAKLLLDEMNDTDGCPGCEEGDDDKHLSSCIEQGDSQNRYVDYTDLESGFMINIRTRATQVSFGDRDGLKHDYVIKKNRKPTAFDHPDIIAAVPDPTTLNRILTTEEIQALLNKDGVLLLEAPQEGADPLAVKEKAEPEPEEPDDGWGDESTEPETGQAAAETTQASGPEPSVPADEPEKPAPKKKGRAKVKKATEDPEKKRQELREELEEQQPAE